MALLFSLYLNELTAPFGDIVGGRVETAKRVFSFFSPLTKTSELFLKNKPKEKDRIERKLSKKYTWHPGVKATHHHHQRLFYSFKYSHHIEYEKI